MRSKDGYADKESFGRLNVLDLQASTRIHRKSTFWLYTITCFWFSQSNDVKLKMPEDKYFMRNLIVMISCIWSLLFINTVSSYFSAGANSSSTKTSNCYGRLYFVNWAAFLKSKFNVTFISMCFYMYDFLLEIRLQVMPLGEDMCCIWSVIWQLLQIMLFLVRQVLRCFTNIAALCWHLRELHIVHKPK